MRILSIPTNMDICYEDHNYRIIESEDRPDGFSLIAFDHENQYLCLAEDRDIEILQRIMMKIAKSYKDGDSVCVIPANLRVPSGAML